MLEEDHILILEDFLPYRLSVLSNTVSNAIAESYGREFGLSIASWRVMAVVGRFPNSSAAQLTSKTAMDKVAISRATAKLEQQGYLQRQADNDDKRRFSLSLSQEGQAIYQKIIPIAKHYESRLLQDFAPEEQVLLKSLMQRLESTVVDW
ncbi:MarR family transcriptional regulator [Alginatibacterium sediminis]|uniref:MarR family transcriptional regulator n=1 Tax=Alginatibacterium sediminis TaxID=2164068 RepID=A0A420EHV6_9ALTE|nr:MarR family transcriptional regulator [Alginatibacterium sediminis]RKF20240.1 MarR family transcriptional regulator [Alginatibacterium sediminis]